MSNDKYFMDIQDAKKFNNFLQKYSEMRKGCDNQGNNY
jgi:hypothetical protein